MPDAPSPAPSDPAAPSAASAPTVDGYCTPAVSVPEPATAAAAPPYADCVQCGEPTEYPVTRPGVVLCPQCEWLEAQRSACSG